MFLISEALWPTAYPLAPEWDGWHQSFGQKPHLMLQSRQQLKRSCLSTLLSCNQTKAAIFSNWIFQRYTNHHFEPQPPAAALLINQIQKIQGTCCPVLISNWHSYQIAWSDLKMKRYQISVSAKSAFQIEATPQLHTLLSLKGQILVAALCGDLPRTKRKLQNNDRHVLLLQLILCSMPIHDTTCYVINIREKEPHPYRDSASKHLLP